MYDVRAWEDIVEHFREIGTGAEENDYWRAVGGIHDLARFVADGPLSKILFGWTSMLDLCIQQTDAPINSGPYLRIAAQRSGKIEFRYFDTTIERRQWRRTVAPDHATTRLLLFLDQLRWIAGPLSQCGVALVAEPRLG
jgi:hypothetical protein